jgi:hypothetical protein
MREEKIFFSKEKGAAGVVFVHIYIYIVNSWIRCQYNNIFFVKKKEVQHFAK